MKGGVCFSNVLLQQCLCGQSPVPMWHYIKGTANHINFFVKCEFCGRRTNNRKNLQGAIDEWGRNWSKLLPKKVSA